jgi:hypothetical protein
VRAAVDASGTGVNTFIEFPVRSPVQAPPSDEKEAAARLELLTVRVWDDVVSGAVDQGAAVAAWISCVLAPTHAAGAVLPHRMVYMPTSAPPVDASAEAKVAPLRVSSLAPFVSADGTPVPSMGTEVPLSFADGYPFLLGSDASLADLNARLAAKEFQPISMNRFRPNIVVSAAADPWEEDIWRSMRIGQKAVFTGAKRCSRCRVTTIDQASGQSFVLDAASGARVAGATLALSEPLATLRTCQATADGQTVIFGSNLVYVGPSDDDAWISVGDPVAILEAGRIGPF